jgi:hypothetical protein
LDVDGFTVRVFLLKLGVNSSKSEEREHDDNDRGRETETEYLVYGFPNHSDESCGQDNHAKDESEECNPVHELRVDETTGSGAEWFDVFADVLEQLSNRFAFRVFVHGRSG